MQAASPSPSVWPLTSQGVRLCWLRSCCAVAEGAAVHGSSSRCPAAVCVSAVLGDALARVAVLGGRDGMPRSLGSVYGGSVTRFLGGGLRGVVSRVIDMPGVASWSDGVAVSRDGCTLLVVDSYGGTHAIHVFSVADGGRLHVVGGEGAGPLQFRGPRQVWVASDDFVFVAEYFNHRVQVLTPMLDFHCFVGVGQLNSPAGVCANDEIVVVSETLAHRISVLSRGDGALLRRFGSAESGDDQLTWPRGLCFTSGQRHVAVADYNSRRVSVFSVEGEFIRHVGVGTLSQPAGVMCSADDELVVADAGNQRVAVFSGSGELLKTMARDAIGGVALHGCRIYAQDTKQCVVFT
jgi:DNA-binding beta-propeller fold protein YncE